MTSATPATPVPWKLQTLPARSPHVAVAMFLAICALVCPPLGSIAWWYAGSELDRVVAGELWGDGTRSLVFAKGCGVAATTACATFLVLAALRRFG
jgi:hypothetical protein